MKKPPRSRHDRRCAGSLPYRFGSGRGGARSSSIGRSCVWVRAGSTSVRRRYAMPRTCTATAILRLQKRGRVNHRALCKHAATGIARRFWHHPPPGFLLGMQRLAQAQACAINAGWHRASRPMALASTAAVMREAIGATLLDHLELAPWCHDRVAMIGIERRLTEPAHVAAQIALLQSRAVSKFHIELANGDQVHLVQSTALRRSSANACADVRGQIRGWKL